MISIDHKSFTDAWPFVTFT